MVSIESYSIFEGPRRSQHISMRSGALGVYLGVCSVSIGKANYINHACSMLAPGLACFRCCILSDWVDVRATATFICFRSLQNLMPRNSAWLFRRDPIFCHATKVVKAGGGLRPWAIPTGWLAVASFDPFSETLASQFEVFSLLSFKPLLSLSINR
jgi:hypothetical protein